MKRQKSRFQYNDRSVLNRKGFALAMKNEQRSVDWGYISEHFKKRMKHFLIENCQTIALQENKEFDILSLFDLDTMSELDVKRFLDIRGRNNG